MNNRYVDIAYALYDPETHPLRGFHVSFIIHKRKIVSIGVNTPKTNPKNLYNPRHADTKGTCSELSAIQKLISKSKIDTKSCKLINIRIDRNSEVNISKPCITCQGLIKYYGFKAVEYSTEDGKFELFNKIY